MSDGNLPSTWAPVSMNAELPSGTWLAARVRVMLSHYYQPDLTDEEARLAMTDWLDALSDVPKAAVEQAIRERVRSDERARPVPGEIRKRALARVRKPEPDRPVADLPEPTEADREAERERRRALCAKLAPEFPEFFDADGTPRQPQLKRMTISEGDF